MRGRHLLSTQVLSPVGADSLTDLSDRVYEPPLTCKLTAAEIKTLIDDPMQVQRWPHHAQYIEKCVKQGH